MEAEGPAPGPTDLQLDGDLRSLSLDRAELLAYYRLVGPGLLGSFMGATTACGRGALRDKRG